MFSWQRRHLTTNILSHRNEQNIITYVTKTAIVDIYHTTSHFDGGIKRKRIIYLIHRPSSERVFHCPCLPVWCRILLRSHKVAAPERDRTSCGPSTDTTYLPGQHTFRRLRVWRNLTISCLHHASEVQCTTSTVAIVSHR